MASNASRKKSPRPIARSTETLNAATGSSKKALNDFRQFLLRGNVVDLAVGVVIGAAFSQMVQALVKDFITPLIAAIGGQPDFSSLSFEINGSKFLYGEFLNALISFILIAFVVFFFVVRPVNRLVDRFKSGETPAPTTRKCPECLSDIPKEARRCAQCGIKVKPVKA